MKAKNLGHRVGKREGIRVHLVSLGCPKNLVDSEMILGGLGQQGFVITPDADDADVLVVNTCGFIDTAKEESVQAILEACEIKNGSDRPKKVIAAGCLSQRYGADLRDEIPELDAIVGLGEYGDLGSTLQGMFASAPTAGPDAGAVLKVTDPTKACHAEVGRFRLTPTHYSYLRISEGCDNPCTFCAIPAIRGRFRSKPVEALEEEARELVASGATELILISQDTTSYGVDLDGELQLATLLERLAAIDGIEWIRVLYAYPAYMTDAMIDAIAALDKVVNYVDMPLQHISDRMLRRMGRRMLEAKTRELVDRMRERIPGLYLRTTFLVGFPGENDHDFAALRDFVRDARFERLGVFPYSKEEDTPSAEFDDQVPEEIAHERMEELMLIQQQIAFEHNRARIGTEVDVVLDSDEEAMEVVDGPALVAARGRSFGESPEIDPAILVERADSGHDSGASSDLPGLVELATARPGAPAIAPLRTSERLTVRITGACNYDLVARPVRRS